MPSSDNTVKHGVTVKNKVFKYFIFTIAMSWSPIMANSFISFIFDLEYKQWSLYKSEICVMTIVLAANNIKDLTESHVLKRGQLLCNILYTLNIINIVFSVLFFSGSNFVELSGIKYSAPESRQMLFTLGTYILATVLGLGVQIGEGIDEMKRRTKEGREKNV